jgi:phosphatidate phosphatase APP1
MGRNVLKLIFVLNLSLSASVFAAPNFIVISDLDDTLKMTDAPSFPSNLWNMLFTRISFVAMPDLMNAWTHPDASKGQPPLYLLTGSPQAITPLVKKFLTANKFPEMRLYLRKYLTTDLVTFKLNSIRIILNEISLPTILVGDDGQHDPEIYAQIQNEFPNRILAVYIHKITGRTLPQNQIGFQTAYEIAENEIAANRIDQTHLDKIALTTLKEMDFKKWVPKYAKCESQLPFSCDKSYNPNLCFHIETRLKFECTERALELEEASHVHYEQYHSY